MFRPRLIPCLLVDGGRLVKTTKFGSPVYVGDPVNTVKIFNEKQVDELIILDYRASKEKRAPDFDMIRNLANECFMPVCYGGGVRSLDHASRLIAGGVEKVAVNSAILDDGSLIESIAGRFGSQSVVAGIDVKKSWLGKSRVWSHARGKFVTQSPVEWARRIVELGAGEILLNNVDRDGTMSGYDRDLIESIAASVSVPVIACGGAASLSDCRETMQSTRAAAAAAGALFVFKGPHRAVLVNYPNPDQLRSTF